MKRYKRKKVSLRTKLLGYFLVFGTIILVILWVFQSFFLKPLYTMSMTLKVDKCASKIVKSIQYSKNVWATIDNAARDNALSVYLYRVGGGRPQREREYSYENPAVRLYIENSDILRYYENTVDNGGKMSFTESNNAEDISKMRRDIINSYVASADSVIKANHMNSVQKDRYIKDIQKQLFKSYEGIFRQMTIYDGALMMKLIDRETGMSSYDIIKEYKNGVAAGFWQGIAKLFENDLKSTYDPTGADSDTELLVQAWKAGEFPALYWSVFWEDPPVADIGEIKLEK